ncbi:hypothetical protein [Paucibacter sp. PLA-PC-4]|uniref:hypothetical protein n=1 Tax=Paucibacter sp. PLA-PC-4 TaxID=2993655 RepID=UPI0022488948|nr:hypothetical protein [Paucibacter sp. PLA-PC-4]
MRYPQTPVEILNWLALAALLLLVALGLRRCAARRRSRQSQHRAREQAQRAAHDCLVQAVQGLLLQLQSIAEGIPRQDPARQALERLLDRADAVLLADHAALDAARETGVSKRPGR